MNVTKSLLHVFFLLTATLLFTGCNHLETAPPDMNPESIAATTTESEPYFPVNFNDFEVPSQLELDRKTTLFINTASFTGGIIKFTGRVEVISLTDFFINSMQKNGWQMNGEVRYKNVLLAFTKPNKNCMIEITAGEFGNKTRVNAYITEDVK